MEFGISGEQEFKDCIQVLDFLGNCANSGKGGILTPGIGENAPPLCVFSVEFL